MLFFSSGVYKKYSEWKKSECSKLSHLGCVLMWSLLHNSYIQRTSRPWRMESTQSGITCLVRGFKNGNPAVRNK